jgi:hypothetical protein
MPDHALVGQRQHIGKGQGRGIAGTCFLANARPIEDGDVAPRLGQIGGDTDADDTAADNGAVTTAFLRC